MKTLFTPSLSCYEALIHLKPLQVPTRHLSLEAVLGHPPLKSDEQIKTVPILDHDPVRILQCLARYRALRGPGLQPDDPVLRDDCRRLHHLLDEDQAGEALPHLLQHRGLRGDDPR